MKKKTRFCSIACLAVALVMCVAQLPSVLGGTAASTATTQSPQSSTTTVQDEGVVRPENLDEGLSLKSLQDIQGRRVTIRQPIMEVTNYNVPRPAKEDVPILEDTYYLGDFTTRKVLNEKAKVTFEGTEGDAKSTNPKYPMRGLENSSKDPKDGQKYFTAFEKYMLLRQAYYFNQHAMEIVEEGHLAKHPAADYIYGAIPDTAEAVTMHIVTDPIYRSPMTTGLYLVPGEKATVTIRGLKEGETLVFYTHHQDTMGYRGYNEKNEDLGTDKAYFEYWDAKILAIAEEAEEKGVEPDFDDLSYGLHGQWVWQNQKVPCMGTTYTITGTGEPVMTVGIGSMYGGSLYVKPTSSAVDFDITGAVLTPHFVLGVTTVDDFVNHYSKAPGLVATLDVENGQLIGPAEDMRNADDIEKLAYFWHSVFAIDISLNGREYNYNMTMCYDMHVPAGEAVALNSNFCAQPTYWFGTCMNYKKLTTNGNWGTLHELGHVQAKTYGVNWGFAEGDGEVWNNTLILLIYSLLCNMDNRLAPVEHGEFVHPYTAVVRSQNVTKEYTKEGETFTVTDYRDINDGPGAHFDQLSMYATLLHSFGPDKFVDMFYTYKLDPQYCTNKRADFVYRIALVDRVNILDWVNENYFANIEKSAFSKSQLEFLESLPTFYPVAYRWANGIDGTETARKYEVDGKHETVFDLSGDNISSPKEVEIVDVTNAKYGKTVYDPHTKKVTYTPPTEVTEYDQFDIIVRTFGGRQVTLNVRFKLLYRGVRTEVWNLSEMPGNISVEQARKAVENTKPDSTEMGSVPGKGDFTHTGVKEYFRSTFCFKATETGDHTFYLRADDTACVKFYQNKTSEDGSPTCTLNAWANYYFTEDTNRKWTVHLNEGDTIFISAELVNWGGPGHLHIGLRKPGQTEGSVEDIPIENIVNADVTKDELQQADAFKGWQPRFADSIKDVTMDRKAETTEWSVLQSPACETTYTAENLIDGDEETFYHSHYTTAAQKPALPHVFVIDTKSDQAFNFFEMVRRTNNQSDRLTSYELYGCRDGDYTDAENGGWIELYKGDAINANAARQRIVFPEQELRYFKFVVTGNAGHTVIRELYAGLQTELNQTVRPRAYEKEGGQNTFTENSANGKLTAKETGAVFEFTFLGSGFELYSDTDPTYGTATVTVDGKEPVTISLAETMAFHRCVYRCADLELGDHTVKIVTTSNHSFNIDFINVVYGTPVDKEDYPATVKEDGSPDFGDETPLNFTREWKTYVPDYKELTRIDFLKAIPEDKEYKDTYRRIDGYIRIYRKGTELAFVYPGTILSPIECGSLFAGCKKLTEINFENFDTTPMRGASGMFNGCSAAATLDLSALKTENVQSMGSMFANCTNLCELDLSSFKLAENANLRNIFEHCGSLASITLPEGIGEDMTSLLPGIFLDTVTHTFTYEIKAAHAGHKLTLHDDHTFDEAHTHPIVEPTCTTEGERGYSTCTECNFDFDRTDGCELLTDSNRAIPAKGHSGEWVLGKMPSCTQGGESYVYVCTECGEEIERGEPLPAIGHYFGLDTGEGHEEGYTLQCNEDGTAYLVYYLVCTNFDYSYYDPKDADSFFTLPPCNHKTTVTIVLKNVAHTDATCTQDASYTFKQTVTEDEVEAALNEGKEISDHLTGVPSVNVDRTIILEGSLGHLYGEPTFHWSNNNTEAEATFVCGRESCKEDAEGHTLTVTATMSHLERVEATCLEDAHTYYTATVQTDENGKTYTETKAQYESGTRKDHNYAGVCELVGDGMHRFKCLNGCEAYGDPVACHAQETWYQSEDGTSHYRLCVCERHMDEEKHPFQVKVDWSETTAEHAHVGTPELLCPVCSRSVTDVTANEVHVGEQRNAATCDQSGSVTYTVTVNYGGKSYTSDSQTYTLEKLGHYFAPAEHDALAWPSEGYSSATLRLDCERCTEHREIGLPAAVKADSSAECGGYSSSTTYTVDPAETGTLGTILAELGGDAFNEEKVKALTALIHTSSNEQVGHVWKLTEVEGSFKWTVAEDKNTATLKETFTCERCGATVSVTFEGECTVVDATCEHPGTITFTVTEQGIEKVKEAIGKQAQEESLSVYSVDTFDAIPRQVHEIAGAPRLAHQYSELEAIEATCTKDGREKGQKCDLCGHIKGATVVPATGHTEMDIPDREPTCTLSGATGGKQCSVCGETLKAQTEVPALGHTEHANGDGRAPTCTEAGRTESVSCTRCNQIVQESEPIAALGHTEHACGDGKAPTCTEAGMTDTYTCDVCGAVVRASEPIPATGHRWETVPGKAPTATEPGLTDGEQCADCGEIRIAQTEIPPLGEGLGAGAIAGIAVGGTAVLSGGGVVLFFILKKRRF